MTETGTSWPEASIAIFGILLVTSIVVVAVWQIFGTWRARMSVAREDAYRRLAEDAAAAQRRTADELERVRAELTELREQTTAVERVLSQVD